MRASAGLLVYRRRAAIVEVFLVHPGGPFWSRKDEGAWSVPKGQIEDGEEPLDAAIREFGEETGFQAAGDFRPLTPVRQRSGKLVHAWMVEGDYDASKVTSHTFTMEWPPKSGRQQEFPEVDRAAWFSVEEARVRLLEAQVSFVDQLVEALALPESDLGA
jgi:predicted NUDIX family NTP pyrophosphohydrolase